MRLALVTEFLLLAAFGTATSDAWIPNHKQQDARQCMNNAPLAGTRLQATTSVDVPPAEIIGNGRIGSTLSKAPGSVILGRQDSIDPNKSGPILIATRNDALDGIVENCPENRKKDLVFMQNGYLDVFLKSKGLMDNTQVLLYLAVASLGADPKDGITSANPEGLTAATGIHAEAFAARLAYLGLKCKVLTPEQYRPAMFEKLM